jgi:uncharacterized protein YegJ (DUF2314 family)
VIEEAHWEIEIDLPGRHPGEVQLARAWLEPASSEMLSGGIDWKGITPEDLEAGRQSVWAVVVSAYLGPEHLLRDYHRMVRLLAALAPEAIVVWDVDALTPRAGHWLHEVAASTTPPSPSTLFTIHDVAPDNGEPHWLHTHGLGRCGSIELDVMNVPPDGAGLIGQLINAVASLLIERGVPEPGEPFFAGQDIELVWLPWEEAVAHVERTGAGSRIDRDESHAGARGVLLSPARDSDEKYESPAVYLPMLEQNPLLFVSDSETERMALLASERLPRFLRLLEQYGSKPGWTFLVKLGYTMDEAESPFDREHLWFEVHGYEAGEVDATLLNEPYRISRMKEGARARHSLDRLSDWSVVSMHGRFDANTVASLERALLEQREAH